MDKVYLLCDSADDKARSINEPWNCGVEFMGGCCGRIVRENGELIGEHYSSSFGWLREDLKRKLDDPTKYEIVDLIGQPVPERFKLEGNGHG